MAAARNGWRFAASVARAGPIRSSERNQSSFVRTSGPSVAKRRSAQIRQPSYQSCVESCGTAVSAIRTQALPITTALIRVAE